MAVTIDGNLGVTSPDFEPSSSTTPTNGLFLPTTNALGFATNSTERLRLDASGNLGLGVTPSAWGSYYPAIEGNGASAFNLVAKANSVQIGANFYQNNSFQNLYTTTGQKAAKYVIDAPSAAHSWYVANSSGTAGDAISFTQAMTLDASGRLLTPNQPAFFVFLNSTTVYSTIGVIPFTRVITNIGSYYSTSTYRFTAPVAGTYSFHFKGFIESATRSSTGLYINGSFVQGFYGPQNQGDMIVGNAIITMAANDYATVNLRQGNVFGDGSGTNNDAATFSGYLIG